MQLEQFLYANEIAKCGSITQAAKNLFITQPSLTIAIQKLEAELGFSLFNRSQKGVQITEKGEEALTYMQQILMLTENLSNLSPSKTDTPAAMQLVAFPTFFDLLDEKFFQQIKAAYPNLAFKMIELTAKEILQDLANGSLNFAISGSPPPVYHSLEMTIKSSKANKLSLQVLYQEPLFLLLPANHRLLGQKIIYINDLKNEIFLYFGEHIQKGQLNLLEGYDFQFKEIIPFYRRTSITKALLMGQGVSMLTKSQFMHDPLFLQNKFVACQIADFQNTIIHYLIYNKRHIFSKIETDILQIVRDFYASMQEEKPS